MSAPNTTGTPHDPTKGNHPVHDTKPKIHLFAWLAIGLGVGGLVVGYALPRWLLSPLSALANLELLAWLALALGLAGLLFGALATTRMWATWLAVVGLVLSGLAVFWGGHVALTMRNSVAGWSGTGSAPIGDPYVPPAYDAPLGDSAPGYVEPAPLAVKQFGEAYRWENGLEVTPAKPVAFTPSRYAYGLQPGQRALKVVMTVRNGTGSAFKLGDLTTTGTFNGQKLSSVSDYEQGVEGTPYDTTVLPGKTATFAIGIPVTKEPGELQFEISPGMAGEAVFFTAQV